jgi:hypothetical protein
VSPLADQLLDAQVAFLAASLSPERFGALLEEELDAWLAVAAELRLGEAVTPEQIKAVASKYAVAMNIPGSIPELAGEIAGRLYEHPAQESTRLADVVARQHVEAYTTKLLELPLVQERLLESPLMVEIVSEWMYRIATDAAAHNQELAGRIPGVKGLLGAGSSILGRVAPDAGVEFETRMRDLSAQMAKLALRRVKSTNNTAEDPWIHDTVMDMYRERSERPVASMREYVTQEDLEDLLVLAYEFWLSFRETEYLHALIDDGVDFFFEKYSDFTLLALLEEFGISRADLVEEAQRFAPPIIELLRERGVIEAFLRRRLAPFYASAEAQALLAEAEGADGESVRREAVERAASEIEGSARSGGDPDEAR